MDIAAGFQFGQQFCHKRRLYQASFVVALLVPRVGEKNVDAVKRSVRQHVLHHFHRIMPHNADIAELPFLNQFEQVADARPVHVDGQKIGIRQTFGDFGGSRTHAETDFQYFGIAAVETGVQINRLPAIIHAEPRPQCINRALLRRRHMPLPQDKTADGAFVFFGNRIFFVVLLFDHVVSQSSE